MNRSRLDTVVRVRRLQERIARGALATSRRAVLDRERQRTRSVQLVDELAAPTPADAIAFLAQRRALARGMRAVADADDAVAAARVRVGTSLDDWTVASGRLEGVERLDDRLAATARVDLERRTATEVDDLSVIRWSRARAAGTPDRRPDGAT